MREYLYRHPDAKVALNQLEYAVPWFDTYNTVAVRKAIEDQVQAILSGTDGTGRCCPGSPEECR
jgi:sn-glycerol 3-phosphate transport system substrate-binding protein